MNSGIPTLVRQSTQLFKMPWIGPVMAILLAVTIVSGCSRQRKQAIHFTPDCSPCQSMLQQIEYPELEQDMDCCTDELLTGPPITISAFQELEPLDMTVEQCVELALANSKVMQKLGGVVVNAPQATTTLYDQAIVETGGSSVERALSDFDAQLNTSLFMTRNERKFNSPIQGGGANSQIANRSNFQIELSKQTATGATFAMRNLTDYSRTNAPIFDPPDVPFGNLYGSVYDMVNQLEFRQPLARGRGTLINRIAGPNAVPGVYNGVLIARIRSDISLADFEAAVRDLVRDVENSYWELYFSYRDLDTKISARESARVTWENRKLRYDNGVGRPDDEAIARQQYYSFQAQAQNVLTGVLGGQPGVLGSDRNLRRLMGMVSNDGRVIRPISEPSLAPITFDWGQSQADTLERRVEIRRQKWFVRQRELELMAAKSLNKWQFDFIGQYGFRGFGDNLFGSRRRPAGSGSAFDDLINGDLDDWQVGVELGGAIGNRTGHLAVRNAELNLVRERTLLQEQQRQVLLDLNEAYTEVDRALAALKTNFDSRVAAQEELTPKRKRVNEGQDQVFFLLDAEQRSANTESAVHRSVADYNKALVNYIYTTGTLLSRYNIYLTEGTWSAEAQDNTVRKAPRFEKRGPNQLDRDLYSVSRGAYFQSTSQVGRDVEFNQEPTPATNEEAPDSLNSDLPSEIEIESPVEEPAKVSRKSRFGIGSPATAAKEFFRSRAKRR